MNNHTKRRKRRRANAIVRASVGKVAGNPVRPHKKRGGRTGQAGKKAIAARLVQPAAQESPDNSPLARAIRKLCAGKPLLRLRGRQWGFGSGRISKGIPSDLGGALVSRGFACLLACDGEMEQYGPTDQAYEWAAWRGHRER